MTKFLFTFLVIVIVAAFNLPASSLAQQSGLNIQLSPSLGNLKINDERIVKITISAAEEISGFDLKFQSSGPIQVIDFIDNLGFDNNFDQFNARLAVETAQGSSTRLSYVFTAPEEGLPKIVDIFAKVRGTGAGQGTISLDYNNSQVINASGQTFRLLPVSAAYNLGSDSSSSAFIDALALPNNFPETAAIVNLKLKLYGAQPAVGQKIKAIAVAVGRVGDGKFESERREFDLNVDQGGTALGTFALPNFRNGNKYSLMIKVDKYLLRRICDSVPTETRLGGYFCQEPTLTIRQGENSFDFSGIELFPGDLGASDGIINGYDLSLVRNNLDNKDAASTADLNYDGLVNSKDAVIIQYVLGNVSGRADQ